MLKMNNQAFVSKIEDKYVCDDISLVMFPISGKGMTIIDEHGIKFHERKNSLISVNHYLIDSNRFLLPHSDSPIHFERIGLKYYKIINQLFRLNQPNIILIDGLLIEAYTTKDEKDTNLNTIGIIPDKKETIILSENELLDLVNNKNALEIIYNSKNSTIVSNPLLATDALISDLEKVNNINNKSKLVKPIKSKLYDCITNDNSSIILIFSNGQMITEVKQITAEPYDNKYYKVNIYSSLIDNKLLENEHGINQKNALILNKKKNSNK